MKIDIILLFNICLITTAIQSQNVDIAGAITLKSTTSAPAGTIRWTGTDFEGWNGADWISLTQDVSVGLLYDIQGNEYRTRRIGNQTWMIDNLRVTSYNDGSVIATGNVPIAWQQAGNLEIGAFADIDMDPTNSPVYGLLYNWYVVSALSSSNKQVCPAGWKVPSEEDIEQLYDFLGTRFIAGRQLKSAGTLSAQTGLWSSPNVGPTGPTLFDALPSGWRDHLGFYQGKSLFTRPWSSTTHTQPAFARTFNMSNDLEIVTVTSVAKDHGNPIRCIKSD